MELKRNFTWMLASRMIALVIAFFTAGIINRVLGPSGRGFYAEMLTWIGFFAVVFGLSMDSAIYHFSNRKLYGDDDNSRFITVFYLSIAFSIIGALGFTLFVLCFPGQVSPKTMAYVIQLDILLVLSMLVANSIVFVQALGNIKFAAIIGMVQAATSLGIIGYGYLSDIIDLAYVILSLILVQAVSFCVLLWSFVKSKFIRGRFSISMAKGILKAGLKQHIATIATFVYMRINQLIVFRYGGESEAGIFAVSLNLALYLSFIPETFRTVLYPRVIHSSDDYEVTVRSIRIGFYGWGLFVFLLFLLSKPIILLYAGKEFLPSVNIFRILLVSAWFLPLSSLLAPYYIKAGAFGLASLSGVLLGIISIGVNLVLVPRYFALGAALATSVTCVIAFTMACIFLWYLSKRSPLIIFRPDFYQELRSLASWFNQRTA